MGRVPGGASSDGRTLYYEAYQSDQPQEDIVSVSLDDPAAKPTVCSRRLRRSGPRPPRRPMARVHDEASGTKETRDRRRWRT